MLNDDAVRTAQYGGRGGQPSNNAPGSNPLGRGQSRSGPSFNDFAQDVGLDGRMEAGRKYNCPLDPNRNIEKRLESRHQFGEEDAIPYELSFKERVRLKVRQQVRRREKYLEDADKRQRENTPEFIQKQFKPKEETMRTMEESLDARRLRKDDHDRKMDPLPEQVQPTRRHSIAQKLQDWIGSDDQQYIFSGTNSQHVNPEGEMATPTGTVFDGATDNPNESEQGSDQRFKAEQGFKPRKDDGMSQQDVFNELADDAKDQDSFLKDQTVAWDWPAEDEIGDNGARGLPTLPSLSTHLEGQLDHILSGDETMEEQLGNARDDDGTRKTNLPKRLQDMAEAIHGPRDDNKFEGDGVLNSPLYQGGDTHGTGYIPLPGV
jgi:hypothetical protein